MWKFEKVFSDDGSELSTASQTTTLGTVINAAYDGRYMWVCATNGIGIYEFWGESSDDEPTTDELDDLLWPRYTEFGPKRKLKLITFIKIDASNITRSTRYLSLSLAPSWTGGAGTTTVGGTNITFTQKRDDLLIATEVTANSSAVALSQYWIVKAGTKMCVSAGANFSKVFVFDIGTQQLDSIVTLNNEPSAVPTVANRNLHFQDGKIWCVNTLFTDTTAQRLISKSLSTGTETSTTINVRPSSVRTWIANGYNGFVYITNHNGVSISKYVEGTGAFSARIRTSAWPHHIFTNSDKRILVASGESLLSGIDWDDDGVHHDNNTEHTVLDLAFDPVDAGKVWVAKQTGTNKLARFTLSSGDVLEVGEEAKDWVINGSGITAPTGIVSVPSQSFVPAAGGTRNTRPYLFVLSASSVYLITIDAALIRPYYCELNGQGAVVGGALNYFGE